MGKRETCRAFIDRIFERGLSDRQRQRLSQRLAEYAAERHAPVPQCAYPGGHPKQKHKKRPKAQRPAKDRNRGAATAASRRLADDE